MLVIMKYMYNINETEKKDCHIGRYWLHQKLYRFMTGGYYDSGLRALMIVSRSSYIVMLKHGLLHAHYHNAIMNICIFAE